MTTTPDPAFLSISSILLNPRLTYLYALDEINGPWPIGEQTILLSPYYSLYYAINIIQGPWPEAESIIETDEDCAKLYKEVIYLGSVRPDGYYKRIQKIKDLFD